MLEAYCANQDKGFFGYEIWSLFTESQLRSFDWYCCPEHHLLVVPYKEHLREGHRVVSHFKIKPGQLSECAYGESEPHLAAKILLATIIEFPDTEFSDGHGLVIPFSKILTKDKPKLEFRWENPRRQTDVVLPLKITHPILGQGIAFEVQMTRITDAERGKRTQDWHAAGFSVSWLEKDAFLYEGQELRGIRQPISITNPYGEKVSEMALKVLDLTKKVDDLEKRSFGLTVFLKRLLPLSRSCLSCDYSDMDRKEGGLICWYGYRNNELRHPESAYWGSCCNNYVLRENFAKTLAIATKLVDIDLEERSLDF